MLSSAFSGILGYLFSLLAGHGHQAAPWLGQHFGPTKKNPKIVPHFGAGLAGWRWIFIMQGVITVVIGIIGWYFIVDFPEVCFHFQTSIKTLLRFFVACSQAIQDAKELPQPTRG
jgi:hypothetical protein